MSKNYFVTIGVIALFVVGLILLAAPKNSTTGEKALVVGSAGSVLSAAETFFDFGKISMADGNVTHAFKVKSSAAEPVKISKVYTSCMCTTATISSASGQKGPFGMPGHGFVPPANVTVGAGEEFEVAAIFNPNAHGPAGVGRNDRTVYVETDSGKVLQLNFTALVAP